MEKLYNLVLSQYSILRICLTLLIHVSKYGVFGLIWRASIKYNLKTQKISHRIITYS
jgi:hypothetical protein